MTEFYTLVDEYLGASDAIHDIRAVVRRLWFYDFNGYPLRIWQGQGALHTTDGNKWLGSMDINGQDYHQASNLQDGRDGSSATYSFEFSIPDTPDAPAAGLFEGIKLEQWRAKNRPLTCYLAVFQDGEALRPQTPIVFYKELTMIQPKFSEMVEQGDGKSIRKKYKLTITAKDANFGRANRPNGTYADTIQKRRADELGVSLDRGSEFLAALANRTYVIP